MWSDADKEWKMHFRRALVRGDQGGDGAVVVSVSASYFVAGYEPSKLGTMQSVMPARGNGSGPPNDACRSGVVMAQ